MKAGKLRGAYEQALPGNPAVPTMSDERPELVVSGVRGHLTPGGDGLMGQSGLEYVPWEIEQGESSWQGWKE